MRVNSRKTKGIYISKRDKQSEKNRVDAYMRKSSEIYAAKEKRK